MFKSLLALLALIGLLPTASVAEGLENACGVEVPVGDEDTYAYDDRLGWCEGTYLDKKTDGYKLEPLSLTAGSLEFREADDGYVHFYLQIDREARPDYAYLQLKETRPDKVYRGDHELHIENSSESEAAQEKKPLELRLLPAEEHVPWNPSLSRAKGLAVEDFRALAWRYVTTADSERVYLPLRGRPAREGRTASEYSFEFSVAVEKLVRAEFSVYAAEAQESEDPIYEPEAKTGTYFNGNSLKLAIPRQELDESGVYLLEAVLTVEINDPIDNSIRKVPISESYLFYHFSGHKAADGA